MKKILMICLLLVSGSLFAQKPVFANAKTTQATVYFNGAELSQTTTVALPAGTSEIVVKNVANYIYENTVQVGTPAAVTVLSVQFTQNYMSEYPVPETGSPALKKVRDSIAVIHTELDKLATQKSNDQKTLELMDRNQQVSGQNNGLSVAELMKLVDYYRAKRNEITANQLTITAREKKLNERLDVLNKKLNADNTPKDDEESKGKLVLQVMCDAAGSYPLDITYLTQGAAWAPYYDLRADNSSGPISMMYKAQVTQNTGIDWKQVKLTLSSGVPNQSSQMPLLSAWFLRFGSVEFKTINGRPNASFVNTLQGQVPGVQIQSGYGQPTGDTDVEVIGYGTRKKDKKDLADYTTVNDNQMNVSFSIDIPYDIASNGKAHSVRMKEIKLPATYRHYAVPKLEQDAFLMADVTDYSKYNLLPGEANIIFDGMYIGKTTINPNQTSDTLNLSMGRDKRISVKREKVADKSGTKFLSGYKEQTFTYETTIRNNKKEAVTLLLKDQYPVSTDKEIEVTLLKDDGAKVNTESGVLTWELKLSPGETKKVRISYKVRHPKDQVIANL
ncbi:DUF4139 domain-containing protein [Flavobacterium sp. RHBU_3]|uniref:DUF4139 domain-containing protein n=1 Tax=Flavobacterium sp. RHBU_3 TaxID=3391184 RepID=UPI0039855ABA